MLAFALVKNTSADWAEFGVCLHPGNTEVRQLSRQFSDDVFGHTDALEAFNAILPNKTRIIEIHPMDLIERIRGKDSSLSKWAGWMLSRYDLH